MLLTFNESYPNNPPHCKFLNPPYHPNVYQADGNICLDILQNRWSPTYDVTALLTSIQSLLPDPNPSSAANPTAGEMFTRRRQAYDAEVRKCVEASWKFKAPGHKDSDDEKEAEETDVEVDGKEAAKASTSAAASPRKRSKSGTE